MLSLYQSSAQAARVGLQRMVDIDDPLAMASQYYMCFKADIKAGCIMIRHKLGDAGVHFNCGIAIADEGAEFIRKSFKTKELAFHRLFIGEVVLIKYLYLGIVDLKLIQILPAFDLWRKSQKRKGIGHAYADGGLAWFLANKEAPKNYTAILEDYRCSKEGKSDLWIDTFSNYMRILETAHSSDRDATIQLIQEGDRLFDKRRKDQYEKYFTIEDWAPYPDYAIDHRLAAIIRFVIDEYGIPDRAINSIHKWRPAKSRQTK